MGTYLVVVTPAVLAGPWDLGHAALTAVHLAIAATCLLRAKQASEPTWVDGWIPLFSLVFLYWEIALINQGITAGYQDPMVVVWEGAIFGSPATELAGRYPSVILSEVLHLAYLLYYPVIFVTPAALFLQRRKEDFITAVLAVISAAVACYVWYVYFPVQGPRYFGPPEGVPDGPIRRLTLTILEGGSSRGAAFPSSHMGITAAQAVVTLYVMPRLGIFVSMVAVGLGVGAVYGGFHYAIDMVLGLGVGVAMAWVLIRWRRRATP